MTWRSSGSQWGGKGMGKVGTNGDRDGLHDLLDHLGVRHTGDSSVTTDVGGDTLEGLEGGESKSTPSQRREPGRLDSP